MSKKKNEELSRQNIKTTDKITDEITCHALGIKHHDAEIDTIFEIGGQDMKFTSFSGDGIVKEAKMNYSCQAGSGQTLENMADVINLDIESSLQELAKSDVHHGEIMVAGGMLDASQLASALVGHQEEKVFNTFTWFNGNFEFQTGIDWPENISVLPLRIFSIVFEGIERWYDGALIKAWMGLNTETPVRRTKMPPNEVPLTPMLKKMVQYLAFPRTIQED